MRILIATLWMILASTGANALQVESGSYYVTGDFGQYGAITGTLSFNYAPGGPLPGLQYDPFTGPFYGYLVTVTASEATVQGCSFSQSESRCGRALRNQPSFVINDLDGDGVGFLTVSGGVQLFNESPGELDIFISLPTGFTVTAVPEPSTWSMLLTGFAALGFAAYRRSLPRYQISV
jgi:hypothetical protein